MKRILAIAFIIALGLVPIAASVVLAIDAQKDLKP
jgi:hypothetical protein